MKVLQNDYILKSLDLPTMEWRQYFSDSEFSSNLLWTIKVEDVPTNAPEEKPKGKKHFFQFLKSKLIKEDQRNALIGVAAMTAKAFGEDKSKKLDPKKQAVIFYPYYTAVKSGILDINENRIVIEGINGDISDLNEENPIQVTMIFEDDDLKIVGDDKFFTPGEILPVIDHAREVRKRTLGDLEQKKNIQLYFSYVYETNEKLKPEGEMQLIYHRFKLF